MTEQDRDRDDRRDGNATHMADRQHGSDRLRDLAGKLQGVPQHDCDEHDGHQEHQAAHQGRLQERFDGVHGSSSGSEIPVYTGAPSCCPRSPSMIARRRGNPLTTRPRVAIVGANFGGLRAAQELGSEFDVTVFDPSPWFEWLPNIHELVSRAKRPADLQAAAQAAGGRGGPSLRA